MKAHLALLAVALVTAGLSGCLSDEAGELSEIPSRGDVAVYKVDGPIYLPGFWPTRGFDYVENKTLRIELGTNHTVMDAAGRLVSTVNVTVKTGEHSATQFIEPVSGTVVVSRMPFPYNGDHWEWRSSGDPPLWGQWENLTGNDGGWPETIQVPCCPKSEAIRDRDGGASTLTLRNVTQGSPDTPWQFQHWNQSWTPPDPDPVDPVTWNGQHAPADAYSLNFTLEEALEELRANDASSDRWMDANPNWQLTTGIYRFSGESTGEREWAWVLLFHAEDGGTLGRQIRKQQTAGVLDEYEVKHVSMAQDLWVEPTSSRMQDVTATWARLWEKLGDRAASNHYAQLRQRVTPAGPDWQGCVDFTTESRTSGSFISYSRLCEDLETGLFGWMRGPHPPKDVLT